LVRNLAVVFLWITGLAGHVQAQEADKTHTFQASVLFGKSSVRAGQELESAMTAAGFADNTYGWSSGNVPFTSEGSPNTFMAHYRVRSRFSAGVIVASTGESETIGWHDLAQSLHVDHGARSIAVTASAKFKVLRLEFGPAWNQTRILHSGSAAIPGNSSSWNKENKLGFIAGATLTLPVVSIICLDAGLQYRYIGSSVAGPYTPAAWAGTQATFPATNINFSHWFFGFGPSIRF